MELTTTLGLAAGALTTLSLVPQVLKIWRTRSACDISLGMFVVFCTGVVLWLIYGLMLGETPIVVWNGVTLVLALAIVAMKLKFA
jgi:MtN3 and saliva related transmembrane protein